MQVSRFILIAAVSAGCGAARAIDEGPRPRALASPPVAVAAMHVDASRVAADETHANVFGVDDDAIRRSLADADIDTIALNRGGRSVAFKITLVDGTVGLYKPEQSYAAHWYSEIASYHVDRALGLGRVPPVIGRRIAWDELRAAANKSPHADEVIVQPDGTVRGAFMWWVPQKLGKIAPPRGWEAWISIDDPPQPSPFQRASEYRRAKRGARRSAPTTVAAPTFADRPAEMSDLILFDALIGNHDRWGGGFTNVRTLGKDGPMVFIDNANGFFARTKPDERAHAQLATVQRMRRSTIEALRGLKPETLEAAMSSDPLAPVLDARRLRAFEERRQWILEHADRMHERFGDAAFPW